MKTKTFCVTYTKKVGGIGTIIVKAPNPDLAIKRAIYHCFTGSNFHNPIEVNPDNYTTPRKQGFQGSERW